MGIHQIYFHRGEGGGPGQPQDPGLQGMAGDRMAGLPCTVFFKSPGASLYWGPKAVPAPAAGSRQPAEKKLSPQRKGAADSGRLPENGPLAWARTSLQVRPFCRPPAFRPPCRVAPLPSWSGLECPGQLPRGVSGAPPLPRDPSPEFRQLARGSGRCQEACRDFRSASAPASRDFRQAARV